MKKSWLIFLLFLFANIFPVFIFSYPVNSNNKQQQAQQHLNYGFKQLKDQQKNRAANIEPKPGGSLFDLSQINADDFSPETFEHINPNDGNVTLDILEFKLPGNGGLSLPIHLAYNPNFNKFLHDVGYYWQLQFGTIYGSPANPQAMFYSNVDDALLVLPDGTKKLLYARDKITSDFITKDYWKGKVVDKFTFVVTRLLRQDQ